MATKKYIQIDATGVLVEDNENIVLASELSASTGAASVGADPSTITNSTSTNVQDVLEDLSSAIDGVTGAVTSVNTLTGAVVISGQNADTNHTAVNYTSAGASITENIAGIDSELGSIKSTISSPFNYKGTFDASAGDYTAISTGAAIGDYYKITTGGTIGPKTWDINDSLVINDTYVSGTVVDGNVDKIDNTDQVTSVNGAQGTVVLTSDDLDSDATITVATPAGATITDDLEALDSAIADNQKGDTIKGFVAAVAITAGDPVYKSSATEVNKAEADQDTALEVIGIAAADALLAAAVEVIPFGPATGLSSYTFTPGDAIFLSEAGGLTATAPTTSGSYILRVGKAVTATSIDVETKNPAIKLA